MKLNQQIEKFIQTGLLVIVAVMPFHAFLSVWLGHLFGHQAVIQGWKEALLLILAVAALALLIREPARLQRLRQPWILAALAFGAVALIVTALTRPVAELAAFGAKTDLEFLLAGIIAATIATRTLLVRLITIILIGCAVVAGYDLLQIFVLPADFLTHFGYGPGTIVPYQHIAIGTSALRFPSTLGGPNQLGTYLIIPLCLSLALFTRQRRWWQLALFAASLISLIWTFSRGAWIGAGVAIIITLIASLPARLRRTATFAVAIVIAGSLLALPIILTRDGQLQYLLLHASVATHSQANLSDSQHAASLQDGYQALIARPFGHGLGTAGPATFHIGPPHIIEDYYLQVGYETGLVGLGVFTAALGLLLMALWRTSAAHALAIPLAAAIGGICLVAIVLPAWADSTTALIAWIAAGTAASVTPKARHV
ncbi:MAG TPA: O-antigen ligase family protein [Candidatus Saccharimonadia bacterium]|nr:O-antigen ligase family protein [Candidatus Saccharimonadia bacterium]